MKWYKCKECGNITTCKEYGCCMHQRMSGPFDTEQEAKNHEYLEKLSEAYVPPPQHKQWLEYIGKLPKWQAPKQHHVWQANTDRTSDVLWKWDDRMKDKMLEAWKAITYNPGNKFNVIFDEFQDYKQSEEDNKMSSAIFCDVCRGSFPIEETSLIVFDAIKKNREGNAIEKQKAYNSHICDTCFGTLMAEPTVAKLPWSKWTKDDDDE